MSHLAPKPRPHWARTLILSILGGAALYVVGYYTGKFVALHVFPDAGPLPDLHWSDGLALLVAVSLMIGAAAVLLTSLSPARLGRMYRLEGPASADEGRVARQQSVVIGFSGLIMLLPMAFSLGGVDPLIALATIALLLAVHTVLNVRVYRQADELLRRSAVEAAALTLLLGQGVLFLWAAAERLAVVPAITAWDIYVVLMALYLTASAVISARRGLA